MSDRSQPTTAVSGGHLTHQEVYRRLQIQVSELRDNLGGMPLAEEAAGIWRGIWYEEAHHSTAIEGNTLVLKQVQRLLDEGRAVGNKELREYLEVRGYAGAADWVYRQAVRPSALASHGEVLTAAEVREVHRAAMAPVWEAAPHPDATHREGPGCYREHDIHAFPGGMTPVSWPLVGAELTAWVDDVNALDADSLTFPEALASLHCRFEQIHPFLDGNGRAGRLVLNLILVRSGYPPAIIYKRDRAKYLRALQRADAGALAPLGGMIARAVLDSLYRFVLPAVAGPAKLVPIEALAGSDLSIAALREAARRGRLQATRASDGRWRSSQRWVDEYRESRYRRR
ncbi:MAG: Fic family protein [Acidimicrobiaceae bacterium]|nr:Fic family protein [Acidimicrobiaceae bacterium]MYG98372.1 Fic family protein [Acidimicrobiaceae bacterium]MYL03036.1 Fic family protein [Acidimicrobiaceae bacterium]